jgi:hypothetical protein
MHIRCAPLVHALSQWCTRTPISSNCRYRVPCITVFDALPGQSCWILTYHNVFSHPPSPIHHIEESDRRHSADLLTWSSGHFYKKSWRSERFQTSRAWRVHIVSADCSVCRSDFWQVHSQTVWMIHRHTQKNTIHDYSQLHSQNGLVVDIQMASKASSSGSSWWEAAQRSRGCRPLRFICRNHADKTWGFHLQADLCASFSFGVCSGHEAGYTTLSALLLTWHQIALCACSRGQESSS